MQTTRTFDCSSEGRVGDPSYAARPHPPPADLRLPGSPRNLMLHAPYPPRCPAMFDSIRKQRLFVFGFVLAWALSHRERSKASPIAQNDDRPTRGGDQDPQEAGSGHFLRLLQAIPLSAKRSHTCRIRTQLAITIDPIAMYSRSASSTSARMQIEFKNVRSKVRQRSRDFFTAMDSPTSSWKTISSSRPRMNAVARQHDASAAFRSRFKDVPAATKALRDVAHQAGVNLVIVIRRVAKAASAKRVIDAGTGRRERADVDAAARRVRRFEGSCGWETSSS